MPTYFHRLMPARAAVATGRSLATRPDVEMIAVCCSGGGIRSVAFSLGALQVLQETDV